MAPAPYRCCFKLVDFFRSCRILFGPVKFKTAPNRMSGNVWEVFVNTVKGGQFTLQNAREDPGVVSQDRKSSRIGGRPTSFDCICFMR